MIDYTTSDKFIPSIGNSWVNIMQLTILDDGDAEVKI